MGNLLQDLRYAARAMRSKPGFTLILFLTLTLGIGVTTAVFSVTNAVLFHPLPFKEGDRLARLYDVRHREDGQTAQVSFSARNFYQVREQAQAFEAVAAQVFLNLTLVLDEEPQRIVGIGVSDGWLSTLGVQPFRGRGFSPDEERAEGDGRVALISYGFWERQFGASSEILGKSISLAGQQYAVIGVMPRGFGYPYNPELWIPRKFDPENGRSHSLNVQARLKPGASLEEAQLELSAIAQRLGQAFPETNAGYTIRAVPLRDVLLEGRDQAIVLLLAAAGFLLLIACANVANLHTARSVGMQRNLAIRTALGASRLRQVRQFLTENVLLSILGGAGGVLLTFWTRDFLMSLVPHEFNYVMDEVAIDVRVLGFAFLLSIAIGAAIASISSLRASRLKLQPLLREGSRSVLDPRGQRLLSILVVGEIALALVLLTGAAMMTRNIYLLGRADLGFDTHNLLTMKAALTEPIYGDSQQRSLLIEQILESLTAVPGVDGAAAANLLPLTGGNVTASFIQEGRPADPNDHLVANHRVISPGYFEALKVPLLAGRTFTAQDRIDSQPVAVIGRGMAQRYWPGEDALGKRIRALRGGVPSAWSTIVGIVGDTQETTPSRQEIKENWYLPFAQAPDSDRSWATTSVQFAVRTTTEPTGMTQVLKQAIWGVDKHLPIFDVAAADDLYSEALSQVRLSTVLASFFSGFGLLMAILGTYGVFSYKIGRRTREIGIRMALGVTPASVFKLVGKQAAGHILLGLALGLSAAMILTRFMSGLLPDADWRDPAVFAASALVLGVVALIACYVPVRRATKVSPIVALRHP